MPSWVLTVLVGAAIANAAPEAQLLRRNTWTGWKNIETIFSFGNSYTDVSFKIDGAQPSTSNPFGNPPIDPSTAFLWDKWITYMTTQYNDSLIETFDLAVSASTVDSSLIPHGPSDYVAQVTKSFIPNYGPKKSTTWQPASTLFAALFGINDVEVSVSNSTAAGLWDDIFKSYASHADQLYQAGGRNFLFLNVPPMDRAPGGNPSLAQTIPDWNARTKKMAMNLSTSYEDVSVFVFDTDVLFNLILDDPTSFEETKKITDVKDYCKAFYTKRPSKPDSTDPSCAVPYEQYFWQDGLHPTFSVHQAMAAQIAVGLRRGGASDASGVRTI